MWALRKDPKKTQAMRKAGKEARAGRLPWQVLRGKPTPLPVVQLRATAHNTKWTSHTAPPSLGLSRRMGKGEERSAGSKTPEGQTVQGSLWLKSILVSGSLKVIANSRGKSMGRPPSNRVASPTFRWQSRAESEEVSGKWAESQARAVPLLWKKPKEEPRIPPSERQGMSQDLVRVTELGDSRSFLTPSAAFCPLSQVAQPQWGSPVHSHQWGKT